MNDINNNNNEEIRNSVIIDCGSGFTKVGFSNEELTPRNEFPTIVGRTKYYEVLYGAPNKKVIFAGDEVETQKTNISIKHPIERGSIINWDDMEKLLNYSFHQVLNISCDQYPILITDSPFNSKINRERMTQLLFETYNSKLASVTNRASLSLIGSGKESAIIAHCGFGESYSVPIYQGKIITKAMSHLPLGGNDLSNYLMEFLKNRDYKFNTYNENLIVNDIKEKLGYVSLNYNMDMQKAATNISSIKEYELVDGRVISLTNELFQSTEPLFQPSLIGCESSSSSVSGGIHEHIYNSFLKCDVQERIQLQNSIVITGGSTLFKGFSERLSNELSNLSPSSLKLNIFEIPDRRNLSWIGGSIFSSLSTFRQHWISLEDYDEYGPQIVNTKQNLFMNSS
ncbi:hypothetical protein ACTFIW_009913 [Dictyostelium discoideum]